MTARALNADAPVSVLVVDDQEVFRNAARDVLAAAPGFALTGEASCGEAALREMAATRPDLVLMDVRMPGIGGIEAARLIAESYPETVVVLLSTHACGAQPDGSGPVIVSKDLLSPAFLRAVWDGATA